jgi:hypothetical protein
MIENLRHWGLHLWEVWAEGCLSFACSLTSEFRGLLAGINYGQLSTSLWLSISGVFEFKVIKECVRLIQTIYGISRFASLFRDNIKCSGVLSVRPGKTMNSCYPNQVVSL